MTVPGFTTASDFVSLPDIVEKEAGPATLQRIFADQGVPFSVLKTPEALLPYRDVMGIYHRASLVMGGSSTGLAAGTDISLTQYGLFGRYLLSSPSLGHLLWRAVTSIGLLESGSAWKLIHSGDNTALSYRHVEQDAVGGRHLADLNLSVAMNTIKLMAGEGWSPLGIDVNYASGPWIQTLEDLFQAPVRCERPAVAIVMERELLDLPNPYIPPQAERPTRTDLLRQLLEPPHDLVTATVAIIREELAQGRPQLEQVARRLSYGPRTLQRRLSEEGTSFRDLAEKILRERAVDLIRDERISLNDIALSLGYSSQTQFSRAVNAWTGHPPGRLRKVITEQVAK